MDVLTAAMTFTWSNGQSEELELEFEETGVTTGHFTATTWRPIDGPALGGLLNLVLPASFNPNTADIVSTYVGSREPSVEDDFPMDETQAASLIFNCDTSWGDATVELVDFAGLTAQIDVIDAAWTFTYPDGTVSVLNIEMTETAAESCRFTYDLGVENIYSVSVSHMSTGEGTFLPFLLRIDAPEDVLTEETVVNTFDRNWSLKRLDFGGGEREYVVDDQENAVVFLPAAYAETHIQTRKQGSDIEVVLVRGGTFAVSHKVELKQGLIVLNEKVGDLLDGIITNLKLPDGNVDPEPVPFGPFTAYVYEAGEGGAHNENTELLTEILWRYVNTKDTVVMFNSRAELQRDVLYRICVIEAAMDDSIMWGDWFPTKDEAKDRPNPEYWFEGSNCTVKEGVLTSVAIGDMFDTTSPYYRKYRMRCTGAAFYLHLRGASIALGASFDLIYLPGSDEHFTHALRTFCERYNRAKDDWIPGDWGYVGLIDAGQNIVYMGGSFLSGDDFADEAMFWGHVPDEGNPFRTLSSWLTLHNEDLYVGRRYLRQPPIAR